MEEKQLVKKAKAGDKAAFASLYGQYKDRLYRYAFYRLGISEDAEDAVSDTIISAYEQICNLKKAEAFSCWIFRILNITCSEYIKKQMNQRNTADLTDYENSNQISAELNTVSLELRQGLGILNNEEQQIVLLSVVAGLTSKEISRAIGLTPGSVRAKLSRSLAKMRNFLE